MWDLVVRGGSPVLPGTGPVEADIAIEAGRIAAIGHGLGDAREVVEAEGKAVIPGVIDPHAHLGLENSFAADARTETMAALACGVTSLGLFVRELERPYSEILPDLIRDFNENSVVDGFFHLQLFNGTQIEDVRRCVDHGVTSFKFYMHGLPGVVPSLTDDVFFAGLREIGSLGTNATACVHAENDDMVMAATRALQAEGSDGGLLEWASTHPGVAEAEAVLRAAFLAEQAGCRLYVVHLSSKEGAAAARRVASMYEDVFFETTSPLLCVDTEGDIGLLGKMSPPLRSIEHRDALWSLLADGVIDTLGTDNTSRSRRTKRPDEGLLKAGTGYPALATHLPAILDEGVRRRGLPLTRLVELCCENPARIFGIYPQKGCLTPGADADLNVLDLEATKVVDAGDFYSFSDFSLFDGQSLQGWPAVVIKGGRVVARDGRLEDVEKLGGYLSRVL